MSALIFQGRGDWEIVGDDVEQWQTDMPTRVEERDGASTIHLDGDGLVRVPRAAAVHIAECRRLQVQNLDGALHIARARGDVTLRDVGEVTMDRLERGLDAERVRGALHARAVGGAARLVALGADAHVAAVGGNLSVESVQAQLTIDAVGGALHAREIGAALYCRNVGGNAVLAAVRGPAQLGNVGGNLSVEGEIADLRIGNVGGSLGVADATLSGSFTVNVGGSASLKLAAGAGSQVAVRAGGGVDCMVTPETDATFTLFDGAGRREVRVGGGAGRVTIQCGGRARVRSADGTTSFTETVAGDARRGWFERLWRPEAPEPPAPPLPPMRPEPPSPPESFRRPRPMPEPQPTGPSADERMAVLRMLADKKISVEQAEKLLAALSGGAA